MSKRIQTLVLGDLARDLFLHLPSFPKPGRDNPVQSAVWRPGGSAFNTAAALTRLAIRSGVIGRVGRDEEGRRLLKEMSRLGIHTRNVQKDPQKSTGMCVVPITPDGERTLLGARGANTSLSEAGLRDALGKIRHLHVSGYTLADTRTSRVAITALRWARQIGATTSLDFTWHAAVGASAAIREALAHVTVALPTAAELRVAMGHRQLSRAAEAALELGAEQVAATLGVGGCRVFSARGAFRAPAFEVRVVNTCGAGDAFNAGYIFGLLRDARPDVCAILGNAAGAAAVASEDAWSPLTRERFVEILREGEKRARRGRHIEAVRAAVALASRRAPTKHRTGRRDAAGRPRG